MRLREGTRQDGNTESGSGGFWIWSGMSAGMKGAARALEKCGMYGETEDNMMRWAELPGLGCTTCPEEPENGRSECHAWTEYSGIRTGGGTGGRSGIYIVMAE